MSKLNKKDLKFCDIIYRICVKFQYIIYGIFIGIPEDTF